jgi:hypothetical protein
VRHVFKSSSNAKSGPIIRGAKHIDMMFLAKNQARKYWKLLIKHSQDRDKTQIKLEEEFFSI